MKGTACLRLVTARHNRPAQVQGLGDAVAVAGSTTNGGGDVVCALRGDGTVWCWGSNGTGQLGDNFNESQSAVPVQVSSLYDAVALSVGGGTVCALRVGGAVQCWGNNLAGQIGDGTTTNRGVPTTVAGLSNVVNVACGLLCTNYALRADGTLWAWGCGGSGQLGTGSTPTFQMTPAELSFAP